MKIPQKRKSIVKFLFYIILGYLLATWGVNHTVNPLPYIRQFSAQTIPVQPIINEEKLSISVHSLEDYPYLLLNVTNSDQFYQTLTIEKEDGSTSSLEFSKGMNCIDMRPLGENIFLSQKELTKYNITFGDVSASNVYYVNICKTISIFVSFIFFFAIWELVQWTKKRYTQ